MKCQTLYFRGKLKKYFKMVPDENLAQHVKYKPAFDWATGM